MFDRLPARFQRRQIPAFAVPAHDPQASLRRVIRKPPADREIFDRRVPAKIRVAEQTGRVHALKLLPARDRYSLMVSERVLVMRRCDTLSTTVTVTS